MHVVHLQPWTMKVKKHMNSFTRYLVSRAREKIPNTISQKWKALHWIYPPPRMPVTSRITMLGWWIPIPNLHLPRQLHPGARGAPIQAFSIFGSTTFSELAFRTPSAMHSCKVGTTSATTICHDLSGNNESFQNHPKSSCKKMWRFFLKSCRLETKEKKHVVFEVPQVLLLWWLFGSYFNKNGRHTVDGSEIRLTTWDAVQTL